MILGACGTNRPPELLPIDPQTAYVGSRFELRVAAVDPDGDTLGFGFDSPTLAIGSRARIVRIGSEAIFGWTPLATDVGEHQIDFSASDGEAAAIEPVAVSVKASPGAPPVFRKPLGEGATLDLGQQKCVGFDVLVEDPDSLQVTLRQEPAIPGSTLKATGAFSARFSWCPASAQASQQRFVLQLVADDGEGQVARKPYALLLSAAPPAGCAGAPPAIVHAPPAPQSTDEELGISATVSDDRGLKPGSPIVYYTTAAPPDPKKLDYATLAMATMTETPAGSGSYHASMPNPTAGLAPGQSATLHYVIVAEDDDDPGGPCDHRSQLPAGGVFQLVVTRPPQGSPSCSGTWECKPGEVCTPTGCAPDQCVPADSNGDGLYFEQASCPAKHFCPAKGPGVAPSRCAESCVVDGDCKLAGYRCKVFDTKRGCGLAGTKNVGTACKDFTECKDRDMCLPWKGGYCTLSDCDSLGGFSGACPSGSACVPLPDSRFAFKLHYVCLKSCTSDAGCRASEGHGCKTVKDDLLLERKVCLP